MKKSLKRVVGVLVLVAMLGSLAACGSRGASDSDSGTSGSSEEQKATKEAKEEKSPASDFETVLLSSQEVKSYDADYAMSAVVAADDEEQTIEMSGNMKLKGTSPEDMLLAADMQMSMMGIEIPVKYYYQDGYMYTDMMDQKVKTELDYEEALQSVSSMPDLYEAGGIDFYGEVTSQEVDGNTVYSYSVPEEKLANLIDLMEGSTATSSVGATGEYTISKFEGTVTVDSDNNIVAQTIQMVMEYSGVSMSMDMSLTMNKIGDEVEVVIPALEGYEEMSVSELE